MKKTLVLILGIAMLLILVSCGKAQGGTGQSEVPNGSSSSVDTDAPEEPGNPVETETPEEPEGPVETVPVESKAPVETGDSVEAGNIEQLASQDKAAEIEFQDIIGMIAHIRRDCDLLDRPDFEIGEVVASLEAGQRYKATGISTPNRLWIRIEFNGGEYYISTEDADLVLDFGQGVTPSDNNSTEAQQSLSFTDVNETVWATGTVNIRSGPNTSHDKLGTLSKGDQILRTGIGVGDCSGWSRIQLSDGAIVYVSSQYLSTTRPSTPTPSTPTSPTNPGTGNGSGSSGSTTPSPSQGGSGSSGSSSGGSGGETNRSQEDLDALEEMFGHGDGSGDGVGESANDPLPPGIHFD